MSSEQVIAEVVAEMRDYVGPPHGGFASAVHAWCDRLSTPAAGSGDASGVAYYRQVADSAMRQSCELLKRAEAAESKLTALLDGIEGLEADLRARERFRNDIADDLKALREKANG